MTIIIPDTPAAFGVGAPLADWSSQPTQTAAAGADTVLKFGTAGAMPFTNLEIGNNSAQDFYYRLDADSTASGAKVYKVASGQHLFISRTGSALHCHTASQVSFGGDSGITVEAFA